MPQDKPCEHQLFEADVRVFRLEDTKGFMAEINVHCAECGKRFQFMGLRPGLNLMGAAVSPDGLEARIAVIPQGQLPLPPQRPYKYEVKGGMH